jgi:hypothetical protein
MATKRRIQSWIGDARRVVETSTAGRVGGTYLDLFTASMLVQIHDALNAENSAKFAAMPILRAVHVGWTLTRRARGAA